MYFERHILKLICIHFFNYLKAYTFPRHGSTECNLHRPDERRETRDETDKRTKEKKKKKGDGCHCSGGERTTTPPCPARTARWCTPWWCPLYPCSCAASTRTRSSPARRVTNPPHTSTERKKESWHSSRRKNLWGQTTKPARVSIRVGAFLSSRKVGG